MTHKTYDEIKSQTSSRLELKAASQKSQVLSALGKNKYIPHETLDAFILKRITDRPGKRLLFEKQPGAEERQKLLREYLRQVDSKNKDQQEAKRQEVDFHKG